MFEGKKENRKEKKRKKQTECKTLEKFERQKKNMLEMRRTERDFVRRFIFVRKFHRSFEWNELRQLGRENDSKLFDKEKKWKRKKKTRKEIPSDNGSSGEPMAVATGDCGAKKYLHATNSCSVAELSRIPGSKVQLSTLDAVVLVSTLACNSVCVFASGPATALSRWLCARKKRKIPAKSCDSVKT